MTDPLILASLIFIAALLYSSVGHAGASGYLAAMALFGLASAVMKPTALALNLLVATVGTIRFASAGHFDWKLFWPFAVLSVPMAYLGGTIRLGDATYKIILGCVLIFGAWRLSLRIGNSSTAQAKRLHLPLAITLGAIIGLLSGLTGVGGGIFLSPLILFLGWADVKRTAGVSVAFILVNSAAGLLGHLASVKNIPHEIVWWGPAALLGGIIGAELGSRHLAPLTMRRMLSLVLLVAGIKMLLTR